MRKPLVITFIGAVLGFSGITAQAQLIAPSNYSLTAIGGIWTYGQTDWNDVVGHGIVMDSTAPADLGDFETILSDGYVFSAPGGTVNGIYRATKYAASLTFTFDGGTDFLLNEFRFLSSRSYHTNTLITFEYALDGGSWTPAAQVTTGALGVTTGAANTYSLALGDVQADAFRLVFTGGKQLSLHEIELFGAPVAPTPFVPATAVPEPATWAGAGVALLAGLALWRRFRDTHSG